MIDSRCVLDRWLSRLQLSPRSQRVLFETSLDWQHEVAMAKTTGDRLVAHSRMSMALLRACLLVGGESLATAAAWPWLLRIALSTAIISWLSWERLVRVSSGSARRSHGPIPSSVASVDLHDALYIRAHGPDGTVPGEVAGTGTRSRCGADGDRVCLAVADPADPAVARRRATRARSTEPSSARDAALLAALPVGLVLLADQGPASPRNACGSPRQCWPHCFSQSGACLCSSRC